MVAGLSFNYVETKRPINMGVYVLVFVVVDIGNIIIVIFFAVQFVIEWDAAVLMLIVIIILIIIFIVVVDKS